MNTMEIAAVRLPEPSLNLKAAGLSHRGKVRADNQDAYHIDDANRFFIVADGMGGQVGGKVASTRSCQAVASTLETAPTDIPTEEAIKAAFEAAFASLHQAVVENADLAKMGTTLVCAVLDNRDEMVVAHLGDSRLYRLRDGHLRCLTDDHNVLSELVRAGVLSGKNIDENKRLAHLLTRAVSPSNPDRPDIFRTIVFPGDRYLLCSDGLHGALDEREIKRLLHTDGQSESKICQLLVDATLEAGAPDNVTTVLIAFN